MDNFEQEYKKAMDEVRASDELRNNVLALKLQKRSVTSFKATLATVAAAVMIMVVAHEYDFAPNSDGVISETVVATQIPETDVSTDETQEKLPQIVEATLKPQTAVKPDAGVVSPNPVAEVETVADVESQALNETAGLEGVPMTARSGGRESTTTQTWEINRYFEYIGENPQDKISAVVPVEYAGETSFEFVVNDEGEPVHDVVTLDYASSKGSISVTVSKEAMFDTTLSGTINATDNGFIAYKVSGDVYYYIFAQGISQDEITAIVNNF